MLCLIDINRWQEGKQVGRKVDIYIVVVKITYPPEENIKILNIHNMKDREENADVR